MGNKLDGFKTDHLISKCCQEPIRFKFTSDGYSLESWCPKCGNYLFHGRTETLLSLWFGNLKSVISNIGYIPKWINKIKRE